MDFCRLPDDDEDEDDYAKKKRRISQPVVRASAPASIYLHKDKRKWFSF